MIAASFSVAYLILSWLLIGIRTEQLVLITIFSSLYLGSIPTRKFIIGFSIFIIFWIIFDYMKAFPNYLYQEVHIKSLYDAERYLFGVKHGDATITPNEYLKFRSVAFVDILAGIFYLCWIPVPLGFAAFLYFKNREEFLKFSLAFLWVNLLGFVVYYLYPAAPPWYVELFGFDFKTGTTGHTAGLIRFDEFVGLPIFQGLYAKSSNVFAAMPSLHSAYPLIVTYYGIKNKLGWVNVIFVIITLGIWISAVYTSHHYVLDVLAGIATASIGIWLFNAGLLKNKTIKKFLDRYHEVIS